MSRRPRAATGRCGGAWLGHGLVVLLGAWPLAATPSPVPAAQVDTGAAPAPHAPLADAEARVDPASGHGRPLPPPSGLPASVPTRASVILLVGLDPYGDVVNVMIERSSRIRQYDRAAIEYAQTLRYQPQVLNGMPVASRLRVQVEFSGDAHSAD